MGATYFGHDRLWPTTFPTLATTYFGHDLFWPRPVLATVSPTLATINFGIFEGEEGRGGVGRGNGGEKGQGGRRGGDPNTEKVCWPEGWGPKTVKGWGPEEWEFLVFFSFSRSHFHFFFSLSGCLLVSFVCLLYFFSSLCLLLFFPFFSCSSCLPLLVFYIFPRAAQKIAFFPSPAPILAFFSLWWSSRGILVVFWSVGTSNVLVFALVLSCGSPRPPSQVKGCGQSLPGCGQSR